MAILSFSRHIRNGFSLVEVCAVILIVTVLGALLIPALAQARNKIRLVQCASNLRQMGTLFALYAQDNENMLPVRHQWASDGTTGLSWEDVLLPYAGQKLQPADYKTAPANYYCPSFLARNTQKSPRVSNGFATSYVCNGYILRDRINYPATAIQYRLAQFQDPSNTLLLTDGIPYPGGAGPAVSTQNETRPSGRYVGYDLHEGRANVLMIDGSVKTMSPTNSGLEVFHTDTGRLYY